MHGLQGMEMAAPRESQSHESGTSLPNAQDLEKQPNFEACCLYLQEKIQKCVTENGDNPRPLLRESVCEVLEYLIKRKDFEEVEGAKLFKKYGLIQELENFWWLDHFQPATPILAALLLHEIAVNNDAHYAKSQLPFYVQAAGENGLTSACTLLTPHLVHNSVAQDRLLLSLFRLSIEPTHLLMLCKMYEKLEGEERKSTDTTKMKDVADLYELGMLYWQLADACARIEGALSREQIIAWRRHAFSQWLLSANESYLPAMWKLIGSVHTNERVAKKAEGLLLNTLQVSNQRAASKEPFTERTKKEAKNALFILESVLAFPAISEKVRGYLRIHEHLGRLYLQGIEGLIAPDRQKSLHHFIFWYAQTIAGKAASTNMQEEQFVEEYKAALQKVRGKNPENGMRQLAIVYNMHEFCLRTGNRKGLYYLARIYAHGYFAVVENTDALLKILRRLVPLLTIPEIWEEALKETDLERLLEDGRHRPAHYFIISALLRRTPVNWQKINSYMNILQALEKENAQNQLNMRHMYLFTFLTCESACISILKFHHLWPAPSASATVQEILKSMMGQRRIPLKKGEDTFAPSKSSNHEDKKCIAFFASRSLEYLMMNKFSVEPLMALLNPFFTLEEVLLRHMLMVFPPLIEEDSVTEDLLEKLESCINTEEFTQASKTNPLLNVLQRVYALMQMCYCTKETINAQTATAMCALGELREQDSRAATIIEAYRLASLNHYDQKCEQVQQRALFKTFADMSIDSLTNNYKAAAKKMRSALELARSTAIYNLFYPKIFKEFIGVIKFNGLLGTQNGELDEEGYRENVKGHVLLVAQYDYMAQMADSAQEKSKYEKERGDHLKLACAKRPLYAYCLLAEEFFAGTIFAKSPKEAVKYLVHAHHFIMTNGDLKKQDIDHFESIYRNILTKLRASKLEEEKRLARVLEATQRNHSMLTL